MSLKRYYFFDKNTAPEKNLSLEDKHFKKIGKSLKIRKTKINDTVYYRNVYGQICKAVVTKIEDAEVHASDSGKPIILKAGEYFYSAPQIKERYGLPGKIQKGDLVKYSGGVLSVNAVENGIIRGTDVVDKNRELVLGPSEYTPYVQETFGRIEKAARSSSRLPLPKRQETINRPHKTKKERATIIKWRAAGGKKTQGSGMYGKEGPKVGSKPEGKLAKLVNLRTVTKEGRKEVPVRKWDKKQKKFVGEPEKYKRNVGGHKVGEVKKVSQFQQFMRRYPGALMKKFGMGKKQAMAAALKKARLEGLYEGDEDLETLMTEMDMDWEKSKQIVKSQTIRAMKVFNLPLSHALGMALTKAREAGVPMIEKSSDMLLDAERSSKFKRFMEHEIPKLKKRGFKSKRALAAALSEARKKHLTKYPPKKEDEDLLKESREAQEYISDKIKKLRKEGYEPKQAEAIAYSYARKRGYDVPEKDMDLEDGVREDAEEISRHAKGIEHEAEEIRAESKDADLDEETKLRHFIKKKMHKMLHKEKMPKNKALAIVLRLARNKGYNVPSAPSEKDLEDWTKMGIYQLVKSLQKRGIEKDVDFAGAPLGTQHPERRKGGPAYMAWLEKFRAALKYSPKKLRALHERLSRNPSSVHADTEKSSRPEDKGEESGLPSLAKYNTQLADKKFPKSKYPPRSR